MPESLTLSPEVLANLTEGEPQPLQSPPKKSRPRKAQPRSTSSQDSSSNPPPSGSDSGRPDGESPQPKRVSVKERELGEFFTYRFGPLIVVLLYFATQDMDKAAFYAPSPEECSTAAPSLARIFARVFGDRKVPTWAYNAFVLSDDTTTLLTVLASYLDRVGLMKQYAPLFVRMFMRGNYNAKPARNDAKVSPTNGSSPTPGSGRQYPGYPDLAGTFNIGGALAAD